MSDAGEESRRRRPGLLGPACVFAVFLGLALASDALLARFSLLEDDLAYRVLRSGFQVGAWLSGATLVNRFLHVLFWERVVSRTIGRPTPRLLVDLSTLLLYVIAITAIVGIVFRLPLTGFWTTSGVIGLILGLALRNMIADLFTGLAINIDTPYRVGDWIEIHARNVQEALGQVQEVSWRTTRLRTDDRNEVIIPNSMLGMMTVTNYTGGPRRFETLFHLDPGVPVERASRILLAAAKSLGDEPGFYQDPAPEVLVSDTTERGVQYTIRYWIAPWNPISPAVARSVLSTRVLEQLARAGLALAHPTRDLFFQRMPQRHLEAASPEDLEALLANVDLFAPLTDDERREVSRRMRAHEFKAGDEILHQGSQGDSMFIVAEGLLDVRLASAGQGEALELDHVGPGRFFGEMSLLTGEPRSASVVAMTDALVYEISKHHVDELFSRRPEIAELVSRIVAERQLRNLKGPDVEGGAHPDATSGHAARLLTRIREFFGWGQGA